MNEVAAILVRSPRILHATLGYIAPLLDTGEDEEVPPTPHALLICNCPSYSYQHRH